VARLLVVEDDDTIGSLLESNLSAHGYDVAWVRAGRAAVREATVAGFDLVLLDVGLPDLDGVEVCRQLRSRLPECVLVMLTARRDEMDVVVGLEAGADDYLTKPFRIAELLARIRAHLRRGTAPAPAVAAVGELVVDSGARRCLLAGREVPLRAKEFDLLARLATEPGAALSRETLMSDVWDENWFGSTKTLDVHVAALRRRLGEAAAAAGAPSPRITTLRGHGYRLET
jgi:DNA-binding response OmpR family regulator